MEYIAKYKCEYCGKVFGGGITGSEKLAFKAIVTTCVNNPRLEPNIFPDKEIHFSQDHYGIGHMIGIEIVGGETDGKQ